MSNRPSERYLSNRFEFAAPGDQQEDAWILRFCDNDVRDMIWFGEDAEQDAWDAWNAHAPGYNCYLFRVARLSKVATVSGLGDVIAERRRQVEAEDFDASHDDMATRGQLAGAAACYALVDVHHWAAKQAAGVLWPWDASWWKPRTPRENLVRAAALIIAEIDRLDRLAAKSEQAA